MSKKQFKSQASSSRVGFGQTPTFGTSAFSNATPSFGSGSSTLSYLAEQPDLSLISDPNVVVNFKNLSKKDGTTKTKALEELHTWLSAEVSAEREIQDAFLEAWVKVYPRASIEVSRRVRQLSHTIQGRVSCYCGKRIARHLPATVGPWLSGLHDGDKVVSTAAAQALRETFPTKEKQEQLLKAYQPHIIEFARDAVLLETPQTLSDERTTTKEDSEAKYTRVVASNIAVVAEALSKLDQATVDKCHQVYEEIVAEKRTWEHLSSKDTPLRRAVLRLIKTCLSSRSDLITDHIDAIAEAVLSKATLRHQSGSSVEFLDTVCDLTREFPNFWQISKASKTSPLERFQSLAKQGSQAGPAHFWDALARLFSLLFANETSTAIQELSKTLEAVHTGLTRKDEPRMNHESAWLCYLKICQTITQTLADEDALPLLKDKVIPIIQQYVHPSHDTSDWTIPTSRAIPLLRNALSIPHLEKVLRESLPDLTSSLVERIQTSQPEQSKEYKSSQDALQAEAAKLFAFEAELIKQEKTNALSDVIGETLEQIISKSLALVESRKGKPYGAAAVVEAAFISLGDVIETQRDVTSTVQAFMKDDIHELTSTLSFPYLVTVLYRLQDKCEEFPSIWSNILSNILNEPDGPQKYNALASLLDPAKMPAGFDLPAHDAELQAFILRQAKHALDGQSTWPLFLGHNSRSEIISPDTFDHLLADITAGLSIEDQTSQALNGMSLVLKGGNPNVRSYLLSSKGTETMQSLLRVTESASEEDANSAVELNTSIQKLLRPASGDGQATDSIFTVISQGLKTADSKSLSVPTLVDLALKVLQESGDVKTDTLSKLLPAPDDWLEALGPFLAKTPPATLALSSPLSGALFLINRAQDRQFSISRDVDGYSSALRIAWYVVSLVKGSDASDLLPTSTMTELYCLLRLTTQLATEELGYFGAYGMWAQTSAVLEDEIAELISESQALLGEWIKKDALKKDGFVSAANDMLLSGAVDEVPVAYQNARAFAESTTAVVDAHGSASMILPDLEEKLRSLRSGKLTTAVVSFLAAFSQPLAGSAYVVRMCNEIIAELTGLDVGEKQAHALSNMVTLNAILEHHKGVVDGVAKQRLIFLIKHVVAWLTMPNVSVELKAETVRCLTATALHIREIYGEHWSSIFDFMIHLWSESGHPSTLNPASTYIVLFHASLRLYATLGMLRGLEESSDDLKEVWSENADAVSQGLLSLLRAVAGLSDVNNQPLRMFNELLARHLSSKKPRDVSSLDGLYPLMTSESSAVQRTAFEILHRQIPKQQEQISLDHALDQKTARLPEELLSLVIQLPPANIYDAAQFDRNMPPELQTYLSSWLLIFDHFRNASEKVQLDYTAHLKQGGHLDDLLSIIFSFLGHERGKPVDVSKFDVSTYSFGIQESPTKDTQWLLSHLYFLCLKRIPILTKTWWRDSASRQAKISVASWTTKHISPLIISDALDVVEAWARTQDDTADDALTVKVNRITHEVHLSKEIDEQVMQVAFKLPPDFPLNTATVEGINRVAMEERKWRSWLINCQGVINFANNSLIEGIITFRRNLAAQLKGHTECAICYSLVSGDKQLPTKKCTTCKKLFHGSCLYRWFKSSNGSTCPLCRNPFTLG